MNSVPVAALMMLLLPCCLFISCHADQSSDSDLMTRLPLLVERIRALQQPERLSPAELGSFYRTYKAIKVVPRRDRDIEFVKRPASAHPKMSFNGDLLALAEMMKYHQMQQNGINNRWLNRLHNLGK